MLPMLPMQSMPPSMHAMLPAMAVLAAPALVVCTAIAVAAWRRWR